MVRVDIKRRWKRSVSVLAAAALVLSAAVPGQAKAGKVSEIQCSKPLSERGKTVKTTLTMKRGKSFQIKTKYAGKKLVYKSSKKKVAAVSKKGKIKAKKIGKTKITVSPKGNKKVKAVITVTVVKSLKKVKKLKLDKKSLALKQGSQGTVKATIVSPKKPTTKKINWLSSNKKIASVNKKGVVTAKSAGTVKITAVAADGQGAKASCNVTVTAGTDVSNQPSASVPSVGGSPAPSGGTDITATPSGGTDVTPTPSGGTDVTPTPSGGTDVTPTPSSGTDVTPTPSSGTDVTPTPVPDKDAVILDAGDRAGIKQGEEVQLVAKSALSGDILSDVQWEVSTAEGVSITATGLLTVSKTAKAGGTITVTVKNKDASDSKKFKVIENKLPILSENQTQLNESTADTPLGLTYRTGSDGEKAFSIVTDPERGEVVKFDSTVGYTSSSYDVLAWMEIDPKYAGKTVTISAYMKYDANSNIKKDMNLIINERFNYSNPAVKWNAKAGEWYYITGTYKLPAYDTERWGNGKNRFYICKDSDLSTAYATYYLDGLSFTVEKPVVESVEVSTADDQEGVYPGHDLQCTAKVVGTGDPSTQVDWSIDPSVVGASISDAGVLTVGDVTPGTKIQIKATSKEDPTKSDTKEITVLQQQINSVEISAEGSPTEIYQNNELQFSAKVTSTGDPDESIVWSVTPSEKVEITADGLLKVGAAAGGTKLVVKATSAFDPTKSDEYEITVRANTVNKVTIESAGNKTTVDAGGQLALSAAVEVTGTPSKEITWSLKEAVDGVSLTSATGSSTTLVVGEDVVNQTEITVCATSVFDSAKSAEIVITVENAVSDQFDMNKLNVLHWEDFSTSLSHADIEGKSDAIISHHSSTPDPAYFSDFSPKEIGNRGVTSIDSETGNNTEHTNCMDVCLAGGEDYVQFSIANKEDKSKTYLLSFMLRFKEVAFDTENLFGDPFDYAYKLPLKLVAIDKGGQETVLKEKIELPYPCQDNRNCEFYSIASTVEVSAGETYRVQIRLAGDLPTCGATDWHEDEGAADALHPVVISVDNVALSNTNGGLATIEMAKGDTYTLSLDTVSTDKVNYYTNCAVSKVTHEDNATKCPNFGEETLVATVDKDGVITASNAGETILIAEITHADGSIDRKQCIVRVDN